MGERNLPHDWFDRPLPANVRIGERSWLYSSFAFRHYFSQQPLGLEVGDDTGLYNGTFFNLGAQGKVAIGNYCTIVGGIFTSNRSIQLGDYVFIAHEVVIADAPLAMPWNCRTETVAADKDRAVTVAPTTIGAGVWIAARACIIGPVQIGAGSVVGAGAVVLNDVPPFTIVAGNPARVVSRVHL